MSYAIQFFKRNLTNTRFDILTAQAFLWSVSMIVLVAGIFKMSRLEMTEAELFIGIMMVSCLTLLLVIAGLLLPIVTFVAQQQKRNPS